MPLDNYFAAEALIKDKLIEANLPMINANNILSAADLKGVTMAALPTPSVAIIYFDDLVDEKPGGRSRQGRSQKTEQLWMVVLAIKNVADTSGVNGRREAGEVILPLLKTLQGAYLSDDHGALMRKKAPVRATFIKGTHLYPFLFGTEISVKAG